MIKRMLSKHFTPSQQSKIYLGLGVVTIFVVAYIAITLLESGPKERTVKQKPTNIVNSTPTRQMGLDAVNDKATQATKDVQELTKELEQARAKYKELEGKLVTSVNLADAVVDAQKEIARLKQDMDNREKNRREEIAREVAKVIENTQVDTILGASGGDTASSRKTLPTTDPARRPTRNTGFSYGNQPSQSSSTGAGTTEYVQPDTNQPPQNQSNDGRTGNLFAVVESVSTTQEVKESPIYVPKGSILTGVLLTGLDAPTAASASNTPIPVLVRLKKEAILPNFAVVEEVRECFAILAGYGDLSSERAFLRGESITCVREDGGIIEANFKSFAVGEDGKNGMKGTLVSRNSTMLANAMMAGFASGMAAMFDVNPVPVITTSSNGTQQYQDVFSTNAVQGGAAKGASQSIGKLADYYMKLADSIHPVIEIGAGRVVDMVITEGAKL